MTSASISSESACLATSGAARSRAQKLARTPRSAGRRTGWQSRGNPPPDGRPRRTGRSSSPLAPAVPRSPFASVLDQASLPLRRELVNIALSAPSRPRAACNLRRRPKSAERPACTAIPSVRFRPHLTIWRWGPHMLVSILHRVTGAGLATVGAAPSSGGWSRRRAGRTAYATFAGWATWNWSLHRLGRPHLGLLPAHAFRVSAISSWTSAPASSSHATNSGRT